MIVFDLRCRHGHVFEGWFKDSAAFEQQRKRQLLTCAVCGDHEIAKAPMAPRLARHGGNRDDSESVGPDTPALTPTQDVAAAYRAMRERILAETVPVGDRFADEARRMHYGDSEKRNIRGRTTLEEARDLLDEGIDFGLLPGPDRNDA